MKSAVTPKPVEFNNTVLRDGHQSLAATRMRTEQMLPIAPLLDEMGFAGLETWGGATIDSCLRFLGENPFDRLRALKKAAPKTPQLMLLRGQNIVQYTSFPDDVVEAFVKANAAAGQDIFRIFDALNDTRNLETAIKTVKECGKIARGEICYTISPVHTIEAFVEMGVGLEKLGCDQIGIKDMAGIIQPQIAARIVSELKKKVKLPIILHTHDTAGLGAASYLAAIDAGVDQVEVSISPFANGTSQPDCLRMLALLEGHPRCPSYDKDKLAEAREHFKRVYEELGAFTNPANERVDADTLIYQVPGGMLSNFRNQLKDQKMDDQFEAVTAEMPYVRKCLGYIPLVTPTSQVVGAQAMLNVKMGRWKVISQNAQDIALGKYGKTPGPIDPDVLEAVKKQSNEEVITGRPADKLEPGMAKLRETLKEKGLPETDEIAVLYAMFPQQVEAYFDDEKRKALQASAAAPPPAKKSGDSGGPSLTAKPPAGASRHMAITINGERREALVEEL